MRFDWGVDGAAAIGRDADVIVMATIPTLLYYLAILVMVEIDARKHGGAGEVLVAKGELWRITKQYWFHFGSLISIIGSRRNCTAWYLSTNAPKNRTPVPAIES